MNNNLRQTKLSQKVEESAQADEKGAKTIVTAPPPTNQTYSMLSDTHVYPSKLLSKALRNHFITIDHTNIPKEELSLKIHQSSNNIIYTKVSQETHVDGDTHLHILVCGKNNITIKTLHTAIQSVGLKHNSYIKASINYQKVKSVVKSFTYLDKEDKNPSTHGTPPTKIKNQQARQDQVNQTYLQAIHLAETGNLEEAEQVMRETNSRDYLLYHNQIRETLKTLNQTRLKYDIPTLDNVTLKDWQQQLWDTIQQTPKARRIIWIHGKPNSGKSFMYNYIKEKHTHGAFDAGQCMSLDNLAYSYDEEGSILWDLPMNFNYQDMLTPLCNVVEKFSDFGQTISSKKYAGKTQHIRGHVIVFANRPCPEELNHRDIINIRAINPKPSIKVIKQSANKVPKKVVHKVKKQDKKDPSPVLFNDRIKRTKPEPLPIQLGLEFMPMNQDNYDELSIRAMYKQGRQSSRKYRSKVKPK